MGFIFLSSLDCFLESNKFCIGPTEFMEPPGKGSSDISIVPRLYIVFIDFYSFLIALSPSVFIGISFEPLDIFSECWISLKFFFCSGIEEINCKTELMFTISWWCTERVSTSSKVPESLLICCTPVTTNYSEWSIEFFLKSFC